MLGQKEEGEGRSDFVSMLDVVFITELFRKP